MLSNFHWPFVFAPKPDQIFKVTGFINAKKPDVVKVTQWNSIIIFYKLSIVVQASYSITIRLAKKTDIDKIDPIKNWMS